MIGMLRFVLSARFLSATVIVGALGLVYGQISYWRGHSGGYSLGVQVTETRFAREAEEERQRQADINDEERTAQRQRFANLMTLIAEKNDLIEDLRDERESDPMAAECGISVGSMQRINRF